MPDFPLVHSYIMLASMMADLVENNCKEAGRRSEGLLLSALSFSSQAVTGVGIVISGYILEIVRCLRAPRGSLGSSHHR